MSYLVWIIAVLSTFALGFLWYGPLFHRAWCRENGLAADFRAGHPARVFGVSFLFAAVAAGGYAHLIGFSDDVFSSMGEGAAAGLVFAATSFGINYQFAGRSFRLWLIDSGYHVVQFALYGGIYAGLHELL